MGRSQGTRSGGVGGRILVIFGPQRSKFEGSGLIFGLRGQNLRSEVDFWSGGSDFGHFGPFWTIFGVQVPVPTQIAQGS